MRRHDLNQVEASCPSDMEDQDQVRRVFQNEVNEPHADAGQPSSIAALPVTSPDNVVDNSYEVDPSDVAIIPTTFNVLIQSFL